MVCLNRGNWLSRTTQNKISTILLLGDMKELLVLLLSISSNLFVGLSLTPLQWLGRVMELVLSDEV